MKGAGTFLGPTSFSSPLEHSLISSLEKQIFFPISTKECLRSDSLVFILSNTRGSKTSDTLVGISSFLIHFPSNLRSSVFSCCGTPLHLPSSSMKVIAVSLGTGIIHCLGDFKSAIHSPFKSPQSPVTLSLKRIG